MSRTIRRPAQGRVFVPSTCAAVVVCLAAACSDPTSPPMQSPTSGATARTLVVAPEGRLEAPGTSEAPLALARAVAMAPAGSTIQLAAGTYPTAGLTIDRSLTLQAAPGATVQLTGSTSIAADQWEPVAHGWRTPWTAAALEPAATPTTRVSTRAAVSLQRFLVDGKALSAVSAPTALGANSFYVDTTNKWLYVGQDPALHPVTTGSADIGVLVKVPNVKLININVTAFGSIGLRTSSWNTTIYGGTYSYNGLIGLDINAAGNLTVSHAAMTNNGQVGLEASHSSNITVEYSNISSNNTGHYNVSQDAAGLKGTNITNITVRGNWVASNASNAVWFDEGSTGVVVAGNQVLRNQNYAIYFELNSGPLIVGNLVYDNGQAGIGIHFTTYAGIYNNTLVNNGTDLDVSASYNRSPYDTYQAVIVNNIFWNAHSMLVNLYRYNGCNSWVYKQVDYNAYYRSNGGSPRYVVNWCNSWYSNMWAFHSGTGYEAHGIEYDNGSDPYFVNAAGGNYHLRSGSPAYHRGLPLPTAAAHALGVTPGAAVSMGALQ